jgi:hypothetical protein
VKINGKEMKDVVDKFVSLGSVVEKNDKERGK